MQPDSNKKVSGKTGPIHTYAPQLRNRVVGITGGSATDRGTNLCAWREGLKRDPDIMSQWQH
ncbi:hypothetical protein [Nitrosomonas sp.]|uniref:hypothetical protein n=1 Tax=Nitrosomonas sp. TaxID=42353 RepID=UPI0028498154|nr:hypothetical protein [Nitrosomonas sp.]MDR4513633.1 hypothetical protein [Nitrosomonas sp.]